MNLATANLNIDTSNPLKKDEPNVTGNKLTGGLNSYSLPQAAPTKTGSIVDFQRVMRAIAQDTYEYRKGKEEKVNKGQFDPGKVSGSIFKDIIDFTEGNRGGDISKMYAAGMSAGEKQIAIEEEKRQFDAKQEEDRRQFDAETFNKYGESNYSSSSGFAAGDGFRTDRHNNPIAAAVTLGGKNQFTNALDAAGIEWTYGDKFPDNPNMVTIKVLGDPIESARTILSNTNSIQGWYLNASSGAILRQMGVVSNEQFKALPKEEQDKIIVGIYKGEVGNGSLVASITGGNKQEVRPEIKALAEAVKNKTATMSSIPMNQRDDVAMELDRMNKTETSSQEQITKDAFDLVTKLIDHKGREGATGTWRQSYVPGTDAKDFSAMAQSLVDKLTLDLIPTMKGMGALSDTEGARLERAGSMLKDRSISEKAYKEELERVRDVLATKISKNPGIVKDSNSVKFKDPKTGAIKSFTNLSEEDIKDALNQGYIRI